MIYGPAINHKTRDTLPTGDVSTGLMFATLAAGKEATVPPSVFPWVDVSRFWQLAAFLTIQARDVAEAFFQSVQKQVSGRFIIAGGVTDYDTIAAVAVKLRPDLQAAGKIPSHLTEGNPLSKGCYKIDSTKAQRELGITCKLFSLSSGPTLNCSPDNGGHGQRCYGFFREAGSLLELRLIHEAVHTQRHPARFLYDDASCDPRTKAKTLRARPKMHGPRTGSPGPDGSCI